MESLSFTRWSMRRLYASSVPGSTKVALKFADPFEGDEYRRQCFRREPEVLKLFQGQADIIQLVADRREFIHPGELPIPFAFYAVELARADLAIAPGSKNAKV